MTRWLAILISALLVAGISHGGELQCAGSNVVVHSTDQGDADTACEGAGDAIDFLARQGLDTNRSVEVHLVRELQSPCLPTGFGCYDHPKRRIDMLVFSECLERKKWVQLPLDRNLCKSLLTHEVAHAVAASNFSIAKPSMRAQEYLASVTMFSTMPVKQREHILAQFPRGEFDTVDQISTTFYQLNPVMFGVYVYRHFLKVSDSKAFIKGVLSGQILRGESGR